MSGCGTWTTWPADDAGPAVSAAFGLPPAAPAPAPPPVVPGVAPPVAAPVSRIGANGDCARRPRGRGGVGRGDLGDATPLAGDYLVGGGQPRARHGQRGARRHAR